MTEHDVTNESHREGCAECTAVWAELDAISAEARALPTLTPSRDLWSGIEARIGGGAADRPATDAPTDASTPARSKAAVRWFATPAVRYAAAAALLVTVTSGVTWRIATERLTDETPVVAEAPVAGDPDTDVPASPEQFARVRAAGYVEDFSTLDLEITKLEALLTQRRDRLDSATVEVVERNLKLIDQAIAECRAAFVKDPASQFLAAELARSYATKITLLRSTATLPVGI